MNDRTKLLLFIPFLALLALLALLLLTFAGSSGVSAACFNLTPPVSGDWVINSNEVCLTPALGSPYTVNGNLEVKGTGNLTLNGVEIRMASAFNDPKTITVRNTGVLNVIGTSKLTATNPAFRYKFLMEKGSNVLITDSTVEYSGYAVTPDDALGPRIESNSVTITRSVFRFNYAGIYIKDASPSIDNSTISNNQFGLLVAGSTAKPTIYDTKIVQNDDGVHIVDASPTIGNGEIGNNMDRGVFILQGSPNIFNNNIHNNAFGVYIQSASPKITNNLIWYHRDGVRSYFSDPVIKGNNFRHDAREIIYMYRSGGTIEGNSLNGPDILEVGLGVMTHGMYLISSTTTIKGNFVYYMNYSAVFVTSGCNLSILNNDISYFEASFGIRVASSTVRIEGNTISHGLEKYSQGISIAGSSGTIKGNTVSYLNYGMYGSFLNESLIIEDNTFQDCPKFAINLYEAHIMIRGNHFISNKIGLNITSSRPQVIGNTFTDNSHGMDINYHTNAYIADNIFLMGNYSISMWYGTATLVNNTIRFSGNYSLFFSSESHVRMIGNHIEGNYQKGVYFQYSDGWLSNNSFSSSGTGVYSWRSKLVMDNNSISKNSLGLYIDESTLYMNGDTIANNSVQGLMTFDSNVTLSGLKVYDNKVGIHSFASRLLLKDSVLANDETGLFLFEELSATIHNVTITGSMESMVAINDNVPALYFEDCTFADNPGKFQVQRSTVVINGSTFLRGEAGIELTNATLRVNGCSFESVNASAITALGGSVRVDNSTFMGNRKGIYSMGATVTVLTSRIEGSNETGIEVEDTHLYISDTRVVNNKDGILELGGSSFEILNCNISSNVVFGLFTSDTSYPVNINFTRKIINEDNAFMIHGRINILEGGQLFLLRANLEFWCVNAGESGLTVMDGGQLVMRENVLSAYDHSKGYFFQAAAGSRIEVSNASFRHIGYGLTYSAQGLEIRTGAAHLSDLFFEDNQVGLYIVGATVQATGLRFNNNQNGMVVQDGEGYLIGSSFNASVNRDIILIRSTGKLLDSKVNFNKVELQDQSSLFVVMWYLRVTALWNDGQPVANASVMLTDKAASALTSTTDAQGNTPRLIVREYQQKGPDTGGYFAFTPHLVNVKFNQLSVDKSQYINVSMTLKISLIDDRPPIVKVTSPAPGDILYSGKVLFIGTAVDEGSSVAVVELSLDGRNWFPANGTDFWSGYMTVADGIHTVQIRATDARGNTIINLVTVEVDLSSPLLQIYYPLDGSITNQTTIKVYGKVHQGAQLLLNKVQVQVAANGTFTYVYSLVEGPNMLSFKAFSKDGNGTMQKDITITRDTVAPVITLVHPTANALVNTSMITVTVSSNEDVSFFMNGKPIGTFGAKADGAFELEEGRNTITIKAVDRAGNSRTYQLNVTLDITKPVLVLEKPITTVFTTKDERLMIKGITEQGVNLTLNGKVVSLGVNGTFQLKSKMRVGKNTFVLTSKDKAGNENTLVLEVTRKEVKNNTPYYILFVVLAVLGVVGDIGAVIYFNKYYKPKGPAKKGEALSEEEAEEKELEEGLEGEDGWDGKTDGDRRYPKRPPPKGDNGSGETEFETVDDLGEF